MRSNRTGNRAAGDIEWQRKEWLPSVVLLAVGFVLLLAGSMASPGEVGVLGSLGLKLFLAFIGAAFAVPACYATAQLMGISFGFLRSAVLKLSAIFVFAVALAQFLPLLVTLLVYAALVALLFEIGFVDVMVFTIILWGVQIGTMLFLAG